MANEAIVSAAREIAEARPIPWLPPVTSAVLSFNPKSISYVSPQEYTFIPLISPPPENQKKEQTCQFP
jgi:hypothetical protein